MNDQSASPVLTSGGVNQNNSKFDSRKFIQGLKDRGRTDSEIADLAAGVVKMTALDLYVAMMTNLKNEDMAEIENVPTEEGRMKKSEELFLKRTGMTVAELAEKARDVMLQAVEDAGK